jgi:hypothetical protein
MAGAAPATRADPAMPGWDLADLTLATVLGALQTDLREAAG